MDLIIIFFGGITLQKPVLLGFVFSLFLKIFILLPRSEIIN